MSESYDLFFGVKDDHENGRPDYNRSVVANTCVNSTRLNTLSTDP